MSSTLVEGNISPVRAKIRVNRDLDILK